MSKTAPPEQDLLALANRLTAARLRAGLSQAEASRRSGVGRSYISELECAKHVPNAFMLAALATAYGVTLDFLMGRTTPETSNTTVPTDAASGRLLLRIVDDLMSEAVFHNPEGLADPNDISHDDRVRAQALREYAARLRHHPAARAALKEALVKTPRAPSVQGPP